MAARKGSAWPIVDAGGTNSAATVGVHAMVTAEDETRYRIKKLGGIHGEEEKLGSFAGIVLELFYQDCLGLLAPLV